MDASKHCHHRIKFFGLYLYCQTDGQQLIHVNFLSEGDQKGDQKEDQDSIVGSANLQFKRLGL